MTKERRKEIESLADPARYRHLSNPFYDVASQAICECFRDIDRLEKREQFYIDAIKNFQGQIDRQRELIGRLPQYIFHLSSCDMRTKPMGLCTCGLEQLICDEVTK